MSSFFQKIVKLFSYDIGIDLGTANTWSTSRTRASFCASLRSSPSRGQGSGRGRRSQAHAGPHPGSVTAIRPLKDGVIADFYITEEMLRYFIKKATARYYLIKPRVLIAIPSGITEVERRAVKESAKRPEPAACI